MNAFHNTILKTLAGAMITMAAIPSIRAEETVINLPSTQSKETPLNTDEGTTATIEPSGEGFRIHSDFSGGGTWTQYWFGIPPLDGPLREIHVEARGSGIKAKVGVRDAEKHIVSCEIPVMGGMSGEPQTYKVDPATSKEGLHNLNYPITGIIIFVKKQAEDTGDLEITKLKLLTGE